MRLQAWGKEGKATFKLDVFHSRKDFLGEGVGKYWKQKHP